MIMFQLKTASMELEVWILHKVWVKVESFKAINQGSIWAWKVIEKMQQLVKIVEQVLGKID